MVVLAGEELVALVLDLGAHNVRLGYSGDDTPNVIAPSVYGECSDGRLVFGEGALGVPREGMEVKKLFTFSASETGEVMTMEKEAVVALLKWALEERLQTKGSAHPVLLVDSPWWGKELREEIISLLFERLEVPAVFLGRSAVLSAFSAGKSTGLVVDLGAAGVSVVPVFDGYVVRSATGGQQRALGGDALTEQCRVMLQEQGKEADGLGVLSVEVAQRTAVDLNASPVFERRKSNMTGSCRAFGERCVLEDFKESLIQVSEASLATESDVAMRPPKYYEFPSGFNRNFGFDRFRLGEILFQPSKYGFTSSKDPSGDQIMASGDEVSAGSSLIPGLPEMIHRAIQSCDVDLRPSLVASVQLCGGGASISGLSERLNADLNRMPTFGRVRVQVATSSNERRNAAWIGGSILASLGGFHQLWLTRQEFQEHGASYIERKSP